MKKLLQFTETAIFLFVGLVLGIIIWQFVK